MADRIFYCICDDDGKFETMTKEQILTAIAQAVEQGYVSDPDSAVFSKIKEIHANGALQIWKGTEAEFNGLLPAPTVSKAIVRIGADGVLYLCTDDTSLEFLDAGFSVDETVDSQSANAVSGAAVYAFVTEQILGGAW